MVCGTRNLGCLPMDCGLSLVTGCSVAVNSPEMWPPCLWGPISFPLYTFAYGSSLLTNHHSCVSCLVLDEMPITSVITEAQIYLSETPPFTFKVFYLTVQVLSLNRMSYSISNSICQRPNS